MNGFAPEQTVRRLGRIRGVAQAGRSAAVSLLLAAAATVTGQEVSTADVVRYNTACSRCHEAECSGRLSFAGLSEQAASGHIRRYAGAVSAREISALAYLLRYTKVQCAYYPIPEPDFSAGFLGAAGLAPYRSPDGKALFLPLGLLEHGPQVLELVFAAPVRVHVEVLSADFEFVVDLPGTAPVDQTRIGFDIDAANQFFLRLRAATPIRLMRIARRVGLE